MQTASIARTGRGAALVAFALLTLVVSGLYGGTLHYPFVFDDSHVIVNNYKLRDTSYIPGFYLGPGMDALDKVARVSYRPFLFTTYALDYILAGPEPVLFRLTNILIHILCAFLVYLLACRLLEKARAEAGPGPPGRAADVRAYALGAAMLFAVHPVQSEAVIYISARSASLTALLCLASLWLFIMYIERGKALWLAASAAVYALGLLSKETALPFMLIFSLTGRAFDGRDGEGAKVPGLAYTPYFAAGALYIALRLFFISRFGLADLEAGSFMGHIADSLAALPGYLQLVFLPLGLSIDHYAGPLTRTADPRLLMGVLIFTAPLAAAAYLYRKRPALSVLLAWPVALMTLEILVPLRDIFVEYRLYLPVIGILMLTAYAAMRFMEGLGGPRKKAALALFAAVLAALVVVSHERALAWQSPASLWSDAVRKYPMNPRAHNNLGMAMVADGDRAGAMRQFREAVRLKMDYDDALNNLGSALAALGRPEEAVRYYRAALTVDNRHYNANFNLVATLFKLERYGEARKACDEMANLYPDSADVATLSGMIASRERPGAGETGSAENTVRK